jgi:hypothetical protein
MLTGKALMLLALLPPPPSACAAAPERRTVSLVWDVDASNGVRLPPGILKYAADAAGSSSGGPATGHGLAANVYGNRGAFPSTAGGRAEIPQTANLSALVAALRRGVAALIPDARFGGVCLLDFESMRDDWNSSSPAVRALSIAHAGGDAALARLQYEAAARRFFEATISTARALRPNCRLGWYSYPTNALPHVGDVQGFAYCAAHPGTCAFDTGHAGNATGYDGPGGAAQREINDGLRWLFEALDVVTPSVYLGERPAQTSGADTAEYVGATTREAVRLAAGGKPVLPVAWLQYDNNWDRSVNKTAPRQLLSPEHAALALGTPLNNGADGVLVWGHLDAAAPPTSPESVSEYNAYSKDVLSGVVASICEACACCTNLTECLPLPRLKVDDAASAPTAHTHAAETVGGEAAAPNLLLVIGDDLGWNNVGWHGNAEVRTPTLDALLRDGIELERMYAYKYCSPTRSSILSGRLPHRVNEQNREVWQAGGGVDLAMEILPAKLRRAGYASHQLGKWHAGMSSVEHMPTARGFASSFGYLGGAEDHWTQRQGPGVDFWSGGPAAGRNGTLFGDEHFAATAVEIIRSHDFGARLFVYLALQVVHEPVEAPQAYIDRYPDSIFSTRR